MWVWKMPDVGAYNNIHMASSSAVVDWWRDKQCRSINGWVANRFARVIYRLD